MYDEDRPIVVYVSRYQDEDSAGKFARFVDSYKKHPAGYEHELFNIKKGYQEHEDVWDAWVRQLDGIPFQIRAYPDRHFVFGYVRNLMEEFPDRYILVCNATSEIRVDQWLDLYMRHANPNRILGTMGSYGSVCHGQTSRIIATTPFTLKNLIRSSSATRRQWWRQFLQFLGYDFPSQSQETIITGKYFYPPPNPHLRTTGLMLPPRLLERIFYWPRSEDIYTKNDEYYFEHGKFGLTVQALLTGMEPLVVGANGQAYTIREWSQSGTFMSDEQNNLIINDWCSRLYENFSLKEKKNYFKAVYGYQDEKIANFFDQIRSSDTSQIASVFPGYQPNSK